MRVVIIGAGGQLGTDLCRAFGEAGHELVPVVHSAPQGTAAQTLDVCDRQKVTETLSAIKPAVIINTAAFHKVELCEDDPAKAFAVNALAVRDLATVTRALGARLVHISTDYVFGGRQQAPYGEGSATDPLQVYGVSKAAGEHFLRAIAPDHLIVRVSGLFGLRGASGKGGNFIETMLRIGREKGTVSVVTDQVFSPTSTSDLAGMIQRLVQAGARGTFHVTNSGSCSWYEFACAIFELNGPKVQVKPTTSAAFGTKVARPTYSVLGNFRLQSEGFGLMRPWKDALKAYLAARG